jgi:hypothetical protein
MQLPFVAADAGWAGNGTNSNLPSPWSVTGSYNALD